jgi:RNA polymerase sigma-B factor
MSAEQGSSKVLTLAESDKAPHALDSLGPIDAVPAELVTEPAPALVATGAIDTRTLSRSCGWPRSTRTAPSVRTSVTR